MPEPEGRPYGKLLEFVYGIGGSMRWEAGGRSGGGRWVIELFGRRLVVPVNDQTVNDLDRLYVPINEPPRSWDDYAPYAPLNDDVFWRLVALFNSN